MSPLVTKEIRLLLPTFLTAMLLAVVPVLVLPNNSTSFATSLGCMTFGILMLAISTFGREFSLRTFPLLLAQPLERDRIWRTKIVVLACAMTTALLTWNLFGLIRFPEVDLNPEVSPLILVVGFAGGLWTTLLMRQFTAAFLFTLFVPAALLVTMGITMGEGDGMLGVSVVLGAYSIAGYHWARRQFFRAEDAAWTGGNISLAGWWSKLAPSAGTDRLRPPQAIRALFWKEIRLHEVTLAGMAVFFLLHLAAVLTRKCWPDTAGGWQTLRTTLDIFGLIWVLVPLLAGGASVAEERRLGTMDGLLSLPVRSQVQFAIKLAVVLVLAGLLSPLLLLAVEGIGGAVRTPSLFSPLSFTTGPEIAALFASFAGLALVAFHSSTLSRNIIQALVTAVVEAVLGTLFLLWQLPLLAEEVPGYTPFVFTGHLQNYLLWPALVATVMLLSHGNFRRFSDGWRIWARNALWIEAAIVLSLLLTIGLYNRVWELLSPLEPAHGPARLTASPGLRVQAQPGSLAVFFPDGRLWHDWTGFSEYSGAMVPTGAKGNHFAEGSNWISTAASWRETVQVRSDGTLWVSEKPAKISVRQTFRAATVLEPAKLVRFGNDTNWQNAVMVAPPWLALLLKTDGTLWGWGPNVAVMRQQLESATVASNQMASTNFLSLFQHWPGFRAFEPWRAGTATNWAKLFLVSDHVCLQEKSGSVWLLNGSPIPQTNQNQLEPGLVMQSWPGPYDNQWQSLTLSQNASLEAWVREDGTLWYCTWGGLDGAGFHSSSPPRQIGTDADWISVASNLTRLAALKRDGTLWGWSLDVNAARRQWGPVTRQPGMNGFGIQRPPAYPELARPATRLGTHNDWVALTGDYSGMITLAADGSLWFWRSPGFGIQSYPDWPQSAPLFGPSRRPASPIENIFAGEK